MRVTALAALISLFGATTASAQTALQYEVRVEGLACPFCSYGLERTLREISGIDDVAVELSSGLARFEVADQQIVTPAAVRQAVVDAGFTVGSIRLTVTGEVGSQDGKTWIALDARHRLWLQNQPSTLRVGQPTTLTGTVVRRGGREVLTVERVGPARST